ncbi:MAG: OadG family protein [Campylobacterales bacterium]|nr:OadG family protein [Campylobacterales bacterium]
MENLVFEGFKFMALGMGTVFSFLILMIGAMNLQSYIIHKFFPDPAPLSGAGKAENKNAKIAAITAAVMHHNNAKS